MRKVELMKHLGTIDKCFSDIKNNRGVLVATNNISRLLGKLMDIELEVNIVNNTREFFGMSVFVDRKTNMELIKEITSNGRTTMNSIDKIFADAKYIVEVDSKLVNSPEVNANPNELTACLLHEIGHVVFTNTLRYKYLEVMKDAIRGLNVEMRMIVRNNDIFKKLFFPVLAQGSMSLSLASYKELDADKFVVDLGYGKFLESLLDKLIMAYGTSVINKDSTKEMEMAAKWSVAQVHELKYRKDTIGKSIDTIRMTSPSKYINDLFTDIAEDIFDGVKSRTELRFMPLPTYQKVDDRTEMKFVMESAVRAEKKAKVKNGKLPKLTMHDLDILDIQANDIRNTHDKIYLLDIADDYAETIHLYKEYCKDTAQCNKVPCSDIQIRDLEYRLSQVRQNIINRDVTPQRYGVFIKYPIGYEG